MVTVNCVCKGALMITEEPKVVKSFRPSIPHYWRLFAIAAFAFFLCFTVFGLHTVTGHCTVFLAGGSVIYRILSVFTTQYVIAPQCLLVKRGPVSRKFKEITYGEINKILVTQGSMQKRFGVGNIIIGTEQAEYRLKGIKHPHKIKELINKEKALEYERRTLLRKML